LKTINNAIDVHKFDSKTKDEVDKYFENRIIKVFFTVQLLLIKFKNQNLWKINKLPLPIQKQVIP